MSGHEGRPGPLTGAWVEGAAYTWQGTVAGRAYDVSITSKGGFVALLV